ncbi:MAG: helix-turn-helix domain-containing protein [Candidatus Acidiferrum sp.]
MFTENRKEPYNSEATSNRRGRGRPRGRTPQGVAARLSLYNTAIALIAERGYEATTLRDVADRAGVSVGLLYRYFPSKRAVILALYDELSAKYASRAAEMKIGKWRDRFMFALTTSLQVLSPHGSTLAALVPVLIGDANEGLFTSTTAFSRQRVHKVFHDAVVGATDAPRPEVAAALGRLLYLVHLAIILWWLLDKSPQQWATTSLMSLVRRALPACALTLRLPRACAFVVAGDKLFRQALFDDAELHRSSPEI